jgi:hypothetical protein
MQLGLTVLRVALVATMGLANDPAAAAQPTATTQRAAAAQDDEAALKADWQGRYRALVQNVEKTSAQLEADRRTYQKARQRGRLKGGTRDEVLTRIAENEIKLAELEQALQQFPEEARRAGVPPGWLREAAASPSP